MDTHSLQSKIELILGVIPVDFGGGCSVEKALVMAYLIKKYELKKTLDIGVYRGRSLFPQAVAHAEYTKGKVFGVDPYKSEDALQYDNPQLEQELQSFALKTDFETIYQEVLQIRERFELEKHCDLVRKRSDEAVVYFKQDQVMFDLIHIDGNHDTKAVMSDLELYLPLLNKDGFIVLDDISWTSVMPAMVILDGLMKKVFELQTAGNDFAVYWNGSSWFKGRGVKRFLNSTFG
jgi:hypothetical protein